MTHVCGPVCFNKIQYFRLPVITTKQARVGYMAKKKRWPSQATALYLQ